MSGTDELLAANAAFARGFDGGDVPKAPAKKVAVLSCMDARIDLYGALGLRPGDAHLIRNAGVLTDDAIRSLAISQHLLGTEEIVVIQHTDCGLLSFSDEEFAQRLEDFSGSRPSWKALTFTDLAGSLRESLERLRECPFLLHREARGFVYEVQTGRLREVGGDFG